MKNLSFNAKITEFFLNRSRLTLLVLGLLVLLGVGSVLSLRTTGFPSPTINLAIITAVYPGASSKTVLEDVTKPLEAAVKSVEGVKSYTSNSRDNFSMISATIDEKLDNDVIKNKIDSAIKSVKLPTGVESPQIISPRVSGDEYYFALVPKDTTLEPAEMYQVFEKFRHELELNPSVNLINVQNPIEKKVMVTIDPVKMSTAGLSYPDIISSLQTWGLTLPIAENSQLENKTLNISATLTGKSLEDLAALELVSLKSAPPALIRLDQISQINQVYESTSDSVVGFRDQGVPKVSQALTFSLDIGDDANLSEYDKELAEVIEKYFTPNSTGYLTLPTQDQLIFRQYKLIEVMSAAKENAEQVNEVVSGMVGGKWDIPGGYVGYLFGGIQLVFLAMLFLVSWRAAIISAIAIPLSFAFSTMWVTITGNNLNTLVLFSLVLVIGLVVDPALVVLEAIQRKIDNGLKGKKAVLQAIDEVGMGLLLAVLTSVIVFIPFGVVSGIFGQIISYIPLTVLPALIGSYIVPLVFLAWAGQIFLKRSSKATSDEHHNLWPIAQSVIRLNKRILHLPVAGQVLIVISLLVLPILIAGYYIGSGKVKMVQFAQPTDSEEILININKYLQKTELDNTNDIKSLVNKTMDNNEVEFAAPFDAGGGGGTTYLVKLTPRAERAGITALSLVGEIEDSLTRVRERFFDVSVQVLGAGPGESSYPISLGIKTNNLDTQKSVALEVTKILNTICTSEENLTINQACPNSDRIIEKVDNGYEDRSTTFIEVLLDRQKLNANQLNPIQVYGVISSIYKINNNTKVAQLKTDTEELPILLESSLEQPKSLVDIQELQIPNLSGNLIKLSDVAEVKEVESVPSIQRVKGETVGVVNAKPRPDYNDQTQVAQITTLVLEEFKDSYAQNYPSELVVETYTEGDAASFTKSFSELGIALGLAIILTYIALVVFFNSFTQPLVILFAIPLTFIGIFPALAYFAGGQLGFLEIIGIIILVGLVENVAIFLIDAANQKVAAGATPKEAIAYASGVRFRPILLTKVTALVSTFPLIVFSELYRSLSVVVVFGLISSGFASLIITPILYIWFKALSNKVRSIKSPR
jgi:HAE1 family hydrophobic/amphiphilic exporter-1